MSHFAKIENNTVTTVIVAEQDFIDLLPDADSWVQTSYNTHGGVHYNPETGEPSDDQSKALRKNYAGIGYTYDASRDAFISQKPYSSWLLDEDTCLWKAPVAMPEDADTSNGLYPNVYRWDEGTANWVLFDGDEGE